MKIAYLAVQLYFLFDCEAAPCSVFICNVNAAALAQSRLKPNLLDPEICQIVIIEYASSQNNKLLHHYKVTQFMSDFKVSRQKFKNFKDLDGISITHSIYQEPFFRKYFPILLQEIRDAFQKEAERTGRTRLLLSVDIVIVNTKYYSFVPLIGNWTHRHHSRLYGNTTDDELNMNYTVNYYLSKGAVKSKLVISVGFSGSVYYNNLVKNDYNKRYHIRMRMDYDQICKKLNDYQKLKGRKMRFPDTCPLYFYDNDRYLIYYDDAISLISKVRYAKEMGLAGVNIYDVSDDDMAGECGDGPFPLLHYVSNECRKP
ncbi:chitinase-3-like protein 2 isoform X1 [Biomphalaria pfeifferi]|uniref:Chitinase-3-like protein 2 isoform X1 n=1 Tax=Biomphalaria pfeifferi TaxID=112525 RepID=A0AAD8B649_BIOPF|nr:chitinase-3-like protein 2 isoform X1 [Biomphalaria pfeifferi]